MSATSRAFGYKHVSNTTHLELHSQQFSGAYLEPLGMRSAGESFGMTTHDHESTVFAYEPLPMGGAPGAYHTVPGGMEKLLVATRHGSQRRGKVEGGAKSKKVNGNGKPSREELNRREQERVHQLNVRIDHIQELLEEAGVKTKKTKQSVLDNAAFYIEKLQGDLVIAQQQAVVAATEVASASHHATHSDSEGVYERCFQHSTMPRIIVDVNMKPLAINAAFIDHSGQDMKRLMKKGLARKYLTKEKGRLEMVLTAIREKTTPLAVATTAMSSQGDVHVMLTASPVVTDNGKLVKIEFSLVPLQGASDNGEASGGGAVADGLDAFLF